MVALKSLSIGFWQPITAAAIAPLMRFCVTLNLSILFLAVVILIALITRTQMYYLEHRLWVLSLTALTYMAQYACGNKTASAWLVAGATRDCAFGHGTKSRVSE